MNTVELLDLPDELILSIMKKVNPQVLLLCSMIDIGNNRLEELAFDRCHSIDLSFDYLGSPHELFLKRFYSDVMPRISHDIQSLTINLHHMSSIKTYLENNLNETLPNLTHLKILLGAKYRKTGIPYTIINHHMCYPAMRKPLFSIVPEFFLLPSDGLGKKLSTLSRSSLMRFVESFEVDDNCMLNARLNDDQLCFRQSIRLTDIRISFWHFDRCVQLLIQLGSQLHSLTISIARLTENQDRLNSEIRSIWCPNLKQMTIRMYRNFENCESCFSLLQRLSNVEYLTLLLAIDKTDTTNNHFIDWFFLETNIVPYMPRLRQFNFHIRSILKNVSDTTIDQIRQSFVKQEESFDYVIDHFSNNYGQCQIYSLPFIGNRLDFVSNRFPLFDNNNTFSNVTFLLLFDDVKPFENIFFEGVARALPQLRTLEIINQLQQREKTVPTKTNIVFIHLTVVILYDIHIDYVKLFIYEINLPSLIELAIDKDILFTIIDQNQQRTSENCSRVGIIHTSNPSYQSRDAIRTFFPRAHYFEHVKDQHQKK